MELWGVNHTCIANIHKGLFYSAMLWQMEAPSDQDSCLLELTTEAMCIPDVCQVYNSHPPNPPLPHLCFCALLAHRISDCLLQDCLSLLQVDFDAQFLLAR